MKRAAKILALLVVLVTVLTVSAFASDFDHCADALKDLGLFQGTNKGYELDRAPTRTEAGVMLVRLLGKEEEAKAITEYTAPFTDVQDWAKPYVQYLYDNGLTKGKNETTFGYSDLCTAQQYATFLLRALGYSDAEGGDFTYAKALDFAREKGVVDMANCDEKNFLRDDVVAMSYTALATAPKSGEADLLTKLVKEGAIQDAKGYDKKFEAFRGYIAAAQADAGSTKTSMTMDMTFDMKTSGVQFMSGSMKLNTAMDMNVEHMDQSKMAMTGSIDMQMDPVLAEDMGMAAGESQFKSNINYYYADGYYYMEMDGQKLKMPLSFEEVMGQVDQMGATASVEPISMLKDITATKSGTTTTYTLTYAGGAMNSLVGTALSMVPTEATGGATAPDMTMGDLTASFEVRSGHMSAMTMKMDMAMTVENKPVSMNMEIKVGDVKTGDSVTVKLPDDLDTYAEVIGGADAPATTTTTAAA